MVTLFLVGLTVMITCREVPALEEDNMADHRLEKEEGRILQEYQVVNFQHIFGFIAVTYYLVIVVQIISAISVVVRPSDKAFWLTGFSMHLQLLFLLGSFKLSSPGLLYSVVNYAGFQGSTYFGNGDLHLDLSSFLRQNYLEHGYSMLKSMSVSPFLLNHRLVPICIYLVSALLSGIPKVGPIFCRLRIVTFLNHIVHFIFFSVTTIGAVVQLGSKATSNYIWYQVTVAVVILIAVICEIVWLISSRENKLVEMKNKRKITFDVTKRQLLRDSNSMLFALVLSPDLAYITVMSLTFAILGEVRGANFFVSGIFIICHLVMLMHLLVWQATDPDRLFSCSIMARVLSQICFALMVLILGTYQFSNITLSGESSKSAAVAFVCFWILFVLLQVTVIVARFIVFEPKQLTELFMPKNYDRRTRLPVVSVGLT